MSELHDEWCAQRVAKILAKRGLAPVEAPDSAEDPEFIAEQSDEREEEE